MMLRRLSDQDKEKRREEIRSNVDIALWRERRIGIAISKGMPKNSRKIKEYIASSVLKNPESAVLKLRETFLKYREQNVFSGSTQIFESVLRHDINKLLAKNGKSELKIPQSVLLIKPPSYFFQMKKRQSLKNGAKAAAKPAAKETVLNDKLVVIHCPGSALRK